MWSGWFVQDLRWVDSVRGKACSDATRLGGWDAGPWHAMAMAGKATYQIPRLGNMGLSWIRMIRLDLWCLRFLFRASPFLAVHNPGWIPIFSVEILLSIVGYQQIPTNLSLAVFCASRHGAECIRTLTQVGQLRWGLNRWARGDGSYSMWNMENMAKVPPVASMIHGIHI